MCDDKKSIENEVTIFNCTSRQKCLDGKEHDWSEWEDFDNGGTAVCSVCGRRAIDDVSWE